jgi:hypothetical protein
MLPPTFICLNPSCGKKVAIDFENKTALTCGDDSCLEFMAVIDNNDMHDGTCDTGTIAKCYGKIVMMYNKKTGGDIVKQFSVKWRNILHEEYVAIETALKKESEDVESLFRDSRYRVKRRKLDCDFETLHINP